MIPKIIKRVFLRDMPFDKWDTTNNEYVHATGCEIQLDDGSWWTEYEDMLDWWDEAPDCVYEDEEEEEE